MLHLRKEKKEAKEKIHIIAKDLKFDMLKNKGAIFCKCERLGLLRLILLQKFQYYKLDSSKRPYAGKNNCVLTKNYLLNSLLLWMFSVIVF